MLPLLPGLWLCHGGCFRRERLDVDSGRGQKGAVSSCLKEADETETDEDKHTTRSLSFHRRASQKRRQSLAARVNMKRKCNTKSQTRSTHENWKPRVGATLSERHEPFALRGPQPYTQRLLERRYRLPSLFSPRTWVLSYTGCFLKAPTLENLLEAHLCVCKEAPRPFLIPATSLLVP